MIDDNGDGNNDSGGSGGIWYLLGIYSVPGLVLGSLHVLTHPMFTMTHEVNVIMIYLILQFSKSRLSEAKASIRVTQPARGQAMLYIQKFWLQGLPWIPAFLITFHLIVKTEAFLQPKVT